VIYNQIIVTEHDMVLNDKMARALKVVAVFEACKGLLVLFAGVALFSLIHQNIQSVAEQLVGHMHLNPAKHIPRIFIEAAGSLTDGRMLLFALLALLYSSMRFIEAYGLWFAKRWAEWFALVSGSIYLPIELYELTKGVSWLKIILVLINLLIVLYMAMMLKRNGNEYRSDKKNVTAFKEKG
jgi:uncharacterized membrane protein (DUF2068 family)